MMTRYAESCTELFYGVLHDLHHIGSKSNPRGQATREIPAYCFTVNNPLNRVCLAPVRKLNIFSTIGRVMWELRGANDLESIAYYTPDADRYAENQVIRTAYGHRLFNGNIMVLDYQSPYVQMLKTLEHDPASRRATALILLPSDDQQTQQEYPCFMAVQFLIRDNRLDMMTYARSSSAFRILPIDVCLMTTIQELTARILGRELGTYTQFCGSLHVYEQDTASIMAMRSLNVMPGISGPEQQCSYPFFASRGYTIPNIREWDILCRIEQMCRTQPPTLNYANEQFEAFYNAYLGKHKAEWIQWAIVFIIYRLIKYGMTRDQVVKSAYANHLSPLYYKLVCEYFDRQEQKQ